MENSTVEFLLASTDQRMGMTTARTIQDALVADAVIVPVRLPSFIVAVPPVVLNLAV
mgnify:CR=1 FL=1